MAGHDVPIVTASRERSHAGRKQARALAPAASRATRASQASVSTLPVRVAGATSISIWNESATFPVSSQSETAPPDRRDACVIDEPMSVPHNLFGVPGDLQALEKLIINPYSPGFVPEYDEVMATHMPASDDGLPDSFSQGLVDVPITGMDIPGASLISSPAALPLQSEDFGSGPLIWDESAFLRAVSLPSSNKTTYFGIFIADDIWQALPFAQLEKRLHCKGFMLDRVAGGHIFDGFAGILSSESQSIVRRPPDKQRILRKLGSMFPGEHPGGSALITANQASETKFARMLLLSLINGFAGLNDVPVGTMLKFFNSVGVSKLLLYSLEQSPKHISRTIADNVFRAAIEATDTKVVVLLLKSKLVDVNETVCVVKDRIYRVEQKHTPIERAADLQSPALVRLLVAEGADVNKTYTRLGGALVRLLKVLTVCSPGEEAGAHRSMTPELVETLDLLFDAGARVEPRILAHLYSPRMLEPIPGLILFLSLRIRPEDHKGFFLNIVNINLLDITVLMSDYEAMQVVQQLINLCHQADCNNCLVEFREQLEKCAIHAARRGYTELLRLLFSTTRVTPRSPGILAAAIRSKNRALIDHVLKLSNDLDPPAADIGVSERTTPIAEALRDGNEELIQLLEEGGALDHLTEGGRFEALLRAAVQEDDLAYFKKILARAVTSKQAYRANIESLNLAGNMDGDAIRMLLAAGAEQSYFRSPSSWNPLRRAIELRDKGLLYDLIGSGAPCFGAKEMKYTIKWGDKSVIAKIICEFPHVAVSSNTIQRLCWTCITEKNTDFFKDLLKNISIEDIDGLEKCLTTAVQLGHVDMISYLLDMGANPCDPSVLKAAIPDRLDTLCLLLQRGERGQKVRKGIGAGTLQFAMGDGADHAKALEELIKTQAIDFTRLQYVRVSRYAGSALTPLGLAIQGSQECDRNLAVMEMFLKAGADPNGIAKMCSSVSPLRTALMVAVEAGHEDAVKMLLRHGADIDGRPRLRTTRTPLQYAAELGNADMVHLLLNPGELSAPADANSPPATRGGGTALQFAAMSGNCNIAAELLRHGAQLDSRPSRVDGRWPLEGAAEKGRLDMIQFLWEVSGRALAAGVVCDGFTERQCLRAMNFARLGGHFGCRDLISELSGIHVDRLETDEYGAPWIAY